MKLKGREHALNKKIYAPRHLDNISQLEKYSLRIQHTFDITFPRCSDPILLVRCLYSGVLEKYSFSLRLAAIMSTFLLISA